MPLIPMGLAESLSELEPLALTGVGQVTSEGKQPPIALATGPGSRRVSPDTARLVLRAAHQLFSIYSTQLAAPPPGIDTCCSSGPMSPGSWDFLWSQEGRAPRPGKQFPDWHWSSGAAR